MKQGAEPDVAQLAEALRQAYAEALSKDPDFPGLTSAELEKIWGTSRGTTGDRLKALKEAGKLESGRRMVESIDGVMRPSPVYRIKE